MDAQSSPQLQAVGEASKTTTYAAQLAHKQIAQTKTKLKPIQYIHGEPTIQFTFKELDNFTIEEGLHQAIVMKLSYGAPSVKELRALIPTQFAIKGRCLIGSLATRHLLLRFDLYEDYVGVLSKQVGFFQFNGEQHQFRTFPWTQWFNPKEETSKALVWVSFPDLPPNMFAKVPLLSIASVVGKPIAIDRATQDRTRPSTARVKVIIDILEKHPKRIRLNYLDEESGKLIEHYQEVIFDNRPLYCTACKHQGHEEDTCRVLEKKFKREHDEVERVDKFQGDLRTILDEKKTKKITDMALAVCRPTVSNAVVDVQHNAAANFIEAPGNRGVSSDAEHNNSAVAVARIQAELQIESARKLVAQNVSGQQSGQQKKGATDGTLGIEKGKDIMVHVEKGNPSLQLKKHTGLRICEPNTPSSKRIVERLPLKVADTPITVAEVRVLAEASPVECRQNIIAEVTAGSICADHAKSGDATALGNKIGQLLEQNKDMVAATITVAREAAFSGQQGNADSGQQVDAVTAELGTAVSGQQVDAVIGETQGKAAELGNAVAREFVVQTDEQNESAVAVAGDAVTGYAGDNVANAADAAGTTTGSKTPASWRVVTKRKTGRIRVGFPNKGGNSNVGVEEAAVNNLPLTTTGSSEQHQPLVITPKQLHYIGDQILQTLNPFSWLDKVGQDKRQMQLSNEVLQLSHLADNCSGNQKSLVPVEQQTAGTHENGSQQVGLNTSVQEIPSQSQDSSSEYHDIQGVRSIQVALNTSAQEVPSQNQDLCFEDYDLQSLFSSATQNKKCADLLEATEEQEGDNIGDHNIVEISTTMKVNTGQAAQQDLDKSLEVGRKTLSPNAAVFVPSKYSLEKHDTGASLTVQPPSAKLNVATRRSKSQKIIRSDKELLDALVDSNSLAPINTGKQIHVVGTSDWSSKIMQDIESFEKGEEEEILDSYFNNAAREAGLSPRQQRSGKSKNKNKTHGRNFSWDDKVSEEVVPRQLPMRQAKLKVAAPTTSTKSNRSKKN